MKNYILRIDGHRAVIFGQNSLSAAQNYFAKFCEIIFFTKKWRFDSESSNAQWRARRYWSIEPFDLINDNSGMVQFDGTIIANP